MARVQNIAVQNKFTKGLVSEATGLTFPEEAATDANNVIFDHLGRVTRRLGFDLEEGFKTDTVNLFGKVLVTYLWKNVAGDGDLSFVVIQQGDVLHFYRSDLSSALSDAKHIQTIDLVNFAPPGVSSVATLECQFSSGNGLLFVTNRRLNTFWVEYNTDTQSFTTGVIDIQIRDFDGDDADTLGISERPNVSLGSLTPAHRYNLENQGWTATTLTDWDTARTDMPSNADVSWYFKNPDDQFDFTTVDDRILGNSPAPKGHFIYSIYNINRSGHVGGATDYSVGFERVNTSAFFAGRVFYAGIYSGKESSKIYFSQIILDKSQYGKCYQANDPTSEKLFDLLPSDGGVIDLLEAGNIFKMVPVFNTLVVFCSNGIWVITGSQGAGFTATDYSINRISSSVNISHTSFVDVEGVPYWWNLEGIYTISIDKQTNSFRIQSITDQTIRKFFLSIPSDSKRYVRGAYDTFSKRVIWLYKTVGPLSVNDRYVYDGILTFNMLNQAFYKWTVDTDTARIQGVITVYAQSGASVVANVVDGENKVLDGTNNVVANVFVSSLSNTSVNKFLVSYDVGSETKLTFGEHFRTSNVDWQSVVEGGVPYESYVIAGYAVRGQGVRKFQENYITVYSDGNANTAFRVRGRWDYANQANTNRWSTAQIITNTEGDYDYKSNRVKIRGHGKAYQIQLFNHGNAPFSIIGWAAAETGNKWV